VNPNRILSTRSLGKRVATVVLGARATPAAGGATSRRVPAQMVGPGG
jgi:hypothetical protein